MKQAPKIMSDLIVASVDQEVSSLLDSWMESEKNKVDFPVPFDIAWRIAGYSTKASAKRALKELIENIDYSTSALKTPNGGRSSELIMLTIRGFKEFCLLARTSQGKAIRLYFIDAEEKWQLVQQLSPETAAQIELVHQQKQLEAFKQKTFKAELDLLRFRDTILLMQPKAVADRILGVTEITNTVTKEVVVNERGQILGHVPGESYNKSELCHRYGILTRTGKPDYRQLNAYLDGLKLPGDACLAKKPYSAKDFLQIMEIWGINVNPYSCDNLTIEWKEGEVLRWSIGGYLCTVHEDEQRVKHSNEPAGHRQSLGRQVPSESAWHRLAIYRKIATMPQIFPMYKHNGPFGYSSWKAFFLFNLEDFLDLTSFGSVVWVWIVLVFPVADVSYLSRSQKEYLTRSQKEHFFESLSMGKGF